MFTAFIFKDLEILKFAVLSNPLLAKIMHSVSSLETFIRKNIILSFACYSQVYMYCLYLFKRDFNFIYIDR